MLYRVIQTKLLQEPVLAQCAPPPPIWTTCTNFFEHLCAKKFGEGSTVGEHWLLKQFSLNHPVEHIQKPKLPKLYVRVETSTSYFIIHNQFVKNCSLSDQLFCSIFLKSPSRQQSYQIIDCK